MKTVEQQATLRHLALSAVACGLVVFSVAAASAPLGELRVGDRAPEFSLPTFTSLLADGTIAFISASSPSGMNPPDIELALRALLAPVTKEKE